MAKQPITRGNHSNRRRRELTRQRFRTCVFLLTFRRVMETIRRCNRDREWLLRILQPDRHMKDQKSVCESSQFTSLDRLPINPFQAPNATCLQLHFKCGFPDDDVLYTSINMSPAVAIQRGDSEDAVVTNPFPSIMVEMVVLDGKFEQEDWTKKEFNDRIVEPREANRPLLLGKTIISLKDGVGTFGNIKITDNSSWIPSRRFQFGVRVVQSSGGSQRIREARSKAFVVLDRRGESSKKHDSPSPMDKIWRLKNIRKGGRYFEGLNRIKIETVQDFLQLSITDPAKLESIMPKKKLEETLRNAQKCKIYRKYHIYSTGEEGLKLLLNSIYEVIGVTFNGCQSFKHLDDLSPYWKYKVEILKQKAYENRAKIEEYNEEPLFGLSEPQEFASIPEASITSLPNSQQITHLNGFVRPPQQQWNEDQFVEFHPPPPSSVNLNQSNTSGAAAFCYEPYGNPVNSSPANGSSGTFVIPGSSSNTDNIWNFDDLPGIEIDYSCDQESVPNISIDVSGYFSGDCSNLLIETDDASRHESVPNISTEISRDITSVAVTWCVLKAIVGWRMQMKKIVLPKD